MVIIRSMAAFPQLHGYILPNPRPLTSSFLSSSRRCCCCFSGSGLSNNCRRRPRTPPSSSSFPHLTHKHQQQHPSSSSVVVLPPPHHSSCYRGSRRKIRCCCSSSSSPESSPSSDDVVELPLFPLPLVLFPGAILPLQIFEFRYRILMHTLLQTDLRFGVLFSDSGSAAGVGCVAEVVKHERLVDDRFFLVCKGQERFRVTRIVRTKPYLVAEVVWMEDRPRGMMKEEEEDPEELAVEVEKQMRDVIRISNRLNGKEVKEKAADTMDLRRNLFPTPFSFFVGSTFEGAPREQQALLEMEDTVARLKRERDTLRNTLNYLTAASAVNDAFPSSSSSSSSSSS